MDTKVFTTAAMLAMATTVALRVRLPIQLLIRLWRPSKGERAVGLTIN
jgi:hypothetical protein